MRAANLFVHNMSRFCGFRKIILGVIRKWSSEAALNFEFYLSDWHFRLTLFIAVFISNTASDEIKPRLFYRVVNTFKNPMILIQRENLKLIGKLNMYLRPILVYRLDLG